MTGSWLHQAESLLQRLCPDARQVFESYSDLLSYRTRLAYLLLSEQLLPQQPVPADRPLLVGISGGQGAGKSTMANFLARLMYTQQRQLVQVLSLDDFYLSGTHRQRLAKEQHPLLATRGVPGTHDIALLGEVLEQLAQGQRPRLPVFDKATDDLLPESRWRQAVKQPDIILLEGWCVGARPQSASALIEPINDLERSGDIDRSWRTGINQRLETDYAELFKQLDKLVYLRVPDINAVLSWRNQQEQMLPPGSAVMSEQRVAQFIQYFERLTVWMQQDLPQRADLVLALAADHEVSTVILRSHSDREDL